MLVPPASLDRGSGPPSTSQGVSRPTTGGPWDSPQKVNFSFRCFTNFFAVLTYFCPKKSKMALGFTGVRTGPKTSHSVLNEPPCPMIMGCLDRRDQVTFYSKCKCTHLVLNEGPPSDCLDCRFLFIGLWGGGTTAVPCFCNYWYIFLISAHTKSMFSSYFTVFRARYGVLFCLQAVIAQGYPPL